MYCVLDELKSQVCEANLELVRRGVVIYTWGNASGIDRDRGLMAIKPSGVSYSGMTADDMMLVDLETGRTVEGRYNPSSDTPTHLELYRAFQDIGGVVHTHSPKAVAFAQAGRAVPALGTTHADYFYGEVPCTRALGEREVSEAYELNTGRVIVETFERGHFDPLVIPAVLVKGHGPFAWGVDADEAVYHAVVLETVAGMAIDTLGLMPEANLESYILKKHYMRKHGKDAYYGQA